MLLINSALNNYTESLHILSGIRVCCSPLLHNKNSTYFVTGPIPNVKKIRGAPIERNRTRTHRLLERSISLVRFETSFFCCYCCWCAAINIFLSGPLSNVNFDTTKTCGSCQGYEDRSTPLIIFVIISTIKMYFGRI